MPPITALQPKLEKRRPFHDFFSGYGNLVPATTEGQVFLVAYGFFGIPLMLISLANAGKFIGDGLSMLRRSSDRQISVPWMILLLVGYMFIGAVLMHSYEEWTYGQAFYWAFISMSSIGSSH